jgi:hypothetical protein
MMILEYRGIGNLIKCLRIGNLRFGLVFLVRAFDSVVLGKRGDALIAVFAIHANTSLLK